jgi:Bacterial Ig domain
MRHVAALAVLGLALVGGLAQFTSAAFTRSLATPANAVGVDQLSNHFSAAPGTAVQAGTSTPIASGNVDSMSLAFGTVPSARTFSNVFRVTNVTGSSQTATLSLSGAPQIQSVSFAASGTTSVTLAAGASSAVDVTTSNTVAGHGTGTLKLTYAGATWEYRTYAVTIDEQPEAPASLGVAQAPSGKLNLTWAASTTTTNLAGYNVYRSTGGAFTKLNATPLAGTTYADTATVDGTTYTYKVRAVTTGTPLESLDSPTANGTADATPPGQPTAIALANGGGAGNAYINSSNKSSLNVSVTLAAGWASTDTVKVTLQSGASSVTKTANPGSGTVTFVGIDVSSFGDGTVTITASSTDAAGNVSASRSASFVKDTVAPAAPTGVYVDNLNSAADQITGTAEAGATVTLTETSPSSATFSGSAGAGAYAINVAAINGNGGHTTAFSYSVTATDAAGNTGPATVVAGSDTR